MATCLGKSCSFDLLCVSFVKVYQSACMLLSPLVLRVGCWISQYLVPVHSLSVLLCKQDY